MEFEDGEVFDVECILDHSQDEDGVLHYRVKWLGYKNEEDMTWEPAEHLQGARAKLNEYWKDKGGIPKAKAKKKESTMKSKRKRDNHEGEGKTS